MYVKLHFHICEDFENLVLCHCLSGNDSVKNNTKQNLKQSKD